MPLNITHDGSLDLATGKTRHTLVWKNKTSTWSALLNKLSQTHRTHETLAEYMAAKKSRQDEIKDVGGFVGGYLAGGKRGKGSVNYRQLVTLDVDNAPEDMWSTVTMLYGCACAVYSTHKHTPEAPRLRLLLPLDRPVLCDEYTAIARRIAGTLGIEYFDTTTYQPERLMYWPSTSKDAEYLFEYQDAEWLRADDVLATYKNWKDSSEWPTSDREGTVLQRDIKKQGDPTEKHGVVGAFCRTFNIHEAIETFLSDVYTPLEGTNRYSYLQGSTAGGLVTYEDKFAYSHHGTDPASMQLCNAFDLVRLHKFGLRDDNAPSDTPINRMPSYLAMSDLACKDKRVMHEILTERLAQTADDFAFLGSADAEGDGVMSRVETNVAEDYTDTSWTENVKLDVDKKGNLFCTIDNMVQILENDPYLKGKLAINLLDQREVATRDLPWRKIDDGNKCLTKQDDTHIRYYMEKRYGLTGAAKISDALTIVLHRHAFHPIRDYLASVKWDGKRRLDTLFIDYLGAADTPYTRTVTRKALTAAVARVYRPGCKFDHVLTLVGKQGVGKSSIISKLGGEWYSDSFSSMDGNKAFEAIQGVWLVEMGELAALRKTEVEVVKHFISKQNDRLRVAYGDRIETFPRQCVFFATTNVDTFLQDATGNRRWWPVNTYAKAPTKDVFTQLSADEVHQIWAEAVEAYNSGEKLFLSRDLEAQAQLVQATHTEEDPRAGIIRAYLDRVIPEGWDVMDIFERRAWLAQDESEIESEKVHKRQAVCVAEVCCEALGMAKKDLNTSNTKAIHTLMRNMSGWSAGDYQRFGEYGKQRAYVRDTVAKTVNVTL